MTRLVLPTLVLSLGLVACDEKQDDSGDWNNGEVSGSTSGDVVGSADGIDDGSADGSGEGTTAAGGTADGGTADGGTAALSRREAEWREPECFN